MSKKKGTRAERELLHLLWNANFATLRTAGSGSITIPSCDLLVGKKGKVFAIECKFIKDKIYILQDRIKELKEFSRKFGAQPLIGVKVMNKGWFFLELNKLEKSKGGNYIVSFDLAKRKGVELKDFISKK
tara:strand:- start:2765 stop:3154 length:390 start_codon:yes stop_codon:yes gene_type:complete